MEFLEFNNLVSGGAGALISIGIVYATFKSKIKVLEDQQKHDSEKFKDIYRKMEKKASDDMVRDFKEDLRNEIHGVKEELKELRTLIIEKFK